MRRAARASSISNCAIVPHPAFLTGYQQMLESVGDNGRMCADNMALAVFRFYMRNFGPQETYALLQPLADYAASVKLPEKVK
jgi:hypothetical protein